MANLDTTSKRRSSCQILKPWQVCPPAPTGGFDLADRQHIAYSYSGIAARGIILVSSNLTITDSVTADVSFSHSLSHSLTIVDSVVGGIFGFQISTTLSIADSVVHNFDKITNPSSTLEIEDSVFRQLARTSLNVSHTLFINDNALANVAIQTYLLSHDLNIIDEVRHVRDDQTLNHTLSITDSVFGSLGLITTLNIFDNVVYNLSKNLISTLVINDNVTPTSDRSLPIVQALNIKDKANGFVLEKISLCSTLFR